MPDPEFLLLGDALWLEFVNTASTPPGEEALPNPGAYLRWTKAVKLESPPDAAGFAEAMRLRRTLLDLALALNQGRNPPPSTIEALNSRLRGMEGREQLVRIGGAWRIRFAPNRPPSALEALARSAAQTLASPLAAVRRCANPECVLFFVDDSPEQGRRWCSGSRCGLRGRFERRRRTRPAPLLADR